MGSFLLGSIWFVKAVFKFVKQQIKVDEPTGLQKSLLNCLGCCIDCFERFIQFLNRHAYIEIALTGSSFIKAAMDGFYLVSRHGGKFLLVAGIGHVIVTLGELLIAAITAGCTWVAINQWDTMRDELYQPVIPVLVRFFSNCILNF